MPQNDGTVCRADRSRRLDILYISYGQNRTSDDTRKNRDRRRRQRNGQILRTRTECGNDNNRKERHGDRQQDIGNTHDKIIDPAAEIA